MLENLVRVYDEKIDDTLLNCHLWLSFIDHQPTSLLAAGLGRNTRDHLDGTT